MEPEGIGLSIVNMELTDLNYNSYGITTNLGFQSKIKTILLGQWMNFSQTLKTVGSENSQKDCP
jgi:hypothetical protein